MLRASLVLAVLAAMVAPLAGAHMEAYSETKPVAVGAYSLILDPTPSPIYVNSTIQFAITTYGQNGAPARADPNITATFPNGTTRELRVNVLTPGYSTASLPIRDRGNHTLTLRIGADEGRASFEAYPDLPFTITALDPSMDVAINSSVMLGFQTVDRELGFPYLGFDDLAVRIQLWADDHSRILNETNLGLQHDGGGAWTSNHTFPQRGMYHMSFASTSGGFDHADVPLLHTFANEPTPVAAPPGSTSTPETPLSLLIVALLVLALARRTS